MKPAEPSLKPQLGWHLVPENCLIAGGIVYPMFDEITTVQAAAVLGLHRVTVSKMVDEGRLKEGQHWRRIGDRGPYLIRKEAIMEMQRQREAKRKGR